MACLVALIQKFPRSERFEGKLMLSLGAAIESSIVFSPKIAPPVTCNIFNPLSHLQQIALFVIPFIVILG